MGVDFSAELPAIYAEFGDAEQPTLGGVPIAGIFDGGYVDAGGLGVAGTSPTFRCATTAAAAAVVDTTLFARAGVSYLVRGKQPIAPDEIETRLILERQ